MNKFEKLYEEIKDMIQWALYQKHITEDAANILFDNLEDIREKIEKE